MTDEGVTTGDSPAGPAPDLSVVVPSVNGLDVLLRCLDNLHLQEGGVRLEVLLPERCGPEVREAVAERFPDVLILPVGSDVSIPAMRRLAFDVARAPSVAVIEDHVLVPSDWAASMLSARAGGARVIGGSVHNAATGTLVDRAAFLCEYGHMLEPQRPGPAEWLTGNNVLYDRELLEAHRTVLEEERWEDRLHEALRESGVELVARPEIDVAHDMHYTTAEYAGQRFLYSRAYAGIRAESRSIGGRVVMALGTLLLPPVLLLRIVSRGWSLPEHRRDVVLSLPLLVVFVSAWALGETVGSLLGPGDALQRVR